jgi:hypothetical protein
MRPTARAGFAAAFALALVRARTAAACPACKSVVDAEVLEQFWGNFSIALAPFVVIGIVAAIAWRIR